MARFVIDATTVEIRLPANEHGWFGWYTTPAGKHHHFAGHMKGRAAMFACEVPFIPHLDKRSEVRDMADKGFCKTCNTFVFGLNRP